MDTDSTTKKPKAQAGVVVSIYFAAARKYPLLLSGLFVSTVVIEIASVVSPLFIRRLIDEVSNGSPTTIAVTALLWTVGIYALIQLLRWFFGRLQMAALVYLESKVDVDLYKQSFAYLIGHSYEFFTSNFSGTLQRRVSRYSQAFDTILETIIFNFVSIVIFAIGTIFVLSQRSILLGMGILVWALLSVYLQTLVARYRHPLRLARAASESALTGTISDSISNQSTVSQFSAEQHEEAQLGTALGNWYRATMRTNIADLWIWGVQGLLALIIEVVLLFAAVFLWKQGHLTVGDFVLIQVYVLGLIDRVWGIGNSIRRLYSTFADAQEMIDILDTPHAIQDIPNAQPLTVSEGAITFADVSFSFTPERSILSNLSLAVKAREKIALVGPSGAGKSTVTKLLLRLYDVTSGHIEIDGQDIAKVTQESLRRAIAFVPQEPILFHRSLMDNIRYGRLDATDDEVMEAAKKAHCHEFITGLPEGYATHVGERGVKLSGGERQRVAIARAILKDAPILILDEATSSLDSESEHLIQDALKVLMEGKTVIVIAHRLSTIMTMDRIVVIEGGAIAAQGTHAELLNHEGGLYHKLWSIQAGSFMADDA